MPDKTLLIYIAKCVTGSLFVFLLAWILKYDDVSWCLISVILVLTPESSEAIPLALTRIKANIVGGAVSVACLFFLPPNAVSITVAIVISILACYFFKLMAGSRAAIAAVIIIMMHGLEYNLPDFWWVTVQRLVSVFVGCGIGLLVTLIFHRNLIGKNNKTEHVES